MNIKATFNTKERTSMRRFRVKSFADFLSKIKLFQPNSDPKELTFTYVDSDNDTITFSTEEEWNEAITHFNKVLMRITISDGSTNKHTRPCSKFGRKCLRGRQGFFKNFWNKKNCHFGVQCDGCNIKNFRCKRFKCRDCKNYDLCGKCMKNKDKIHPNHNFVFVKKPRMHSFNWGPVKCQVWEMNGFGNKEEEKKEEVKKEDVKEEVKEEKKKIEVKENVEQVPEVKEKVEQVPEVKENPVVEVEIVKKKEEVPEVKEEVFKYEGEMSLLKQMGFDNEKLNKHLLNQKKGNLERTVQLLIEL